jgi:ethanolamine utilization protein EutA (predicted chaperonin)
MNAEEKNVKKNTIMEEFAKAKKDNSLLNTLNIDELLAVAEKDQNKWLEKKTLSSIAKENFETIKTLEVSSEIMQKWCEHLIEFRKVNEIYEFKCGVPTKMIRKKEGEPYKFSYIGVLLTVSFKDTGTQLCCLSPFNKKQYKYNYDGALFFQKITDEEKMLLTALEYI